MLKSNRIVALNIGASHLALAEFEPLRGGGLELDNYGIAPLGLDPDSESESSAYIVSALRDLVREKHIKPGPVQVSISGQIVFPRYVKLPPVSGDKLNQIMRHEAQQNCPFPIDEVVWDYQLFGDPQTEMGAIMVAVKTELVKTLTDCVQAVGFDPELVDVSAMALYNAVRFNYGDQDGCTMVLDIGARATNVIFMEGDRMSFRSIPVAGNGITKELMREFDMSFKDAEELKHVHAFVGFGGAYEGADNAVADRVSKIVRNVMTRQHAEISRTINFYRSQQGGSQPTLALLTGGSSVIPHADTFFREKLKIEVDFLNPFQNVPVSDAIDTDAVAKDVQLLGEVVGLGLRRCLKCPMELDLMPPDLVARKVFERRLPFFGLAAVGIFLAMLVWWAYVVSIRESDDRRLAEVSTRAADLSALDRRIIEVHRQQQAVRRQAEDLATLVSQRTRWHMFLGRLQEHVQDGMWITALQARGVGAVSEGDRRLELRGLFFKDKVTIQAVEDFVAALQKAVDFVTDVKLLRVSPFQNTDFIDEFVVEMNWTRPVSAPPTGGNAP